MMMNDDLQPIIDCIEGEIPAWMYYGVDPSVDTGVATVRLEYCSARFGFMVDYEAPKGAVITILGEANAEFNRWLSREANDAEYALWEYLTGEFDGQVAWMAAGYAGGREFCLPVMEAPNMRWEDEPSPYTPFKQLTAPILETMLRNPAGDSYLQRFAYFPEIDRLVLFKEM